MALTIGELLEGRDRPLSVRMLDKGYLTVMSDPRLEVSGRLKKNYRNGRSFYPLHGQPIISPSDKRCIPGSKFLRWHNENVYRA